jgi:hypothetical protein
MILAAEKSSTAAVGEYSNSDGFSTSGKEL